MNAECLRIADQLRRAFDGDAWHGPSVRDLLKGIAADAAASRPLASAHNVWELVVHIDMYIDAALDALQGIPMPPWYGTGQDWPPLADTSAQAWDRASAVLFQNAELLANAIARLTDDRLRDTVPGRDYDFYYLLHGVVQHSLYHGGQIAILKKVTDGG